MRKKTKLFALLLLIAGLGLSACGTDSHSGGDGGSGGSGEQGGGSGGEGSGGEGGSGSGGEGSGGEGSGGEGGGQTFTPTHAGTQADPYTVSDAYGLINVMSDGQVGTATVYVKGTITSENSDIYYNAKYTSGTFMIFGEGILERI